ncbi:MAG TPA: LssY C-terminal domain-containing protein [Terriglobales bacterium]|nr:LssY C-terminal domain-containing protein [Terriglobales bacterium]
MRALFLLLLGLARPASACTDLAAGTRFWVRLTAPVSSYSARRDMSVHGFLLDPPECDNSPVLPIKIPVEGRVVAAHRVGLGLWHETASLELEFTRLLPPEMPPIEIHARVLLVDNAREEVKKGVIHGIRATDTPQGTISSRLKYMPSLHLYPDPFLLGYKLLFPVFPEPEIYLQAGTDLELELSHPASVPADLSLPAPYPPQGDLQELAEDLAGLPERTFTPKGKEADVVNFVFAGSDAQLEQAFTAAGWKPSDRVSRRSVRHSLSAFLLKDGYPTAPISPQLLENRASELTLEKTFDSYEKRDHLRIWSLPPGRDGEPLWAGAAVRETGATLSIKHKGFMHHVSPNLLDEQHIVVRDLLAVDCVDSVGAIARPEMSHIVLNATGEIFRTDGTLTVVYLKSCAPDPYASDLHAQKSYHPGSRPFRTARKWILTVRSDLWRANILYSGFDLTRDTVQAVHRNSMHRADLELYRQSSQSSVVSESRVASRPSE